MCPEQGSPWAKLLQMVAKWHRKTLFFGGVLHFFFLRGDKIKNRSEVIEQKMVNKAQLCRARALLSHEPRKFCQQKSHMLRKPI